jgi:hypothetical protein
MTKYRSDGWYHQRLSIITLTILVVVSAVLTLRGWWVAGLGLVVGGICGLLIDPDLDQRDTTRAENRMYRFNKAIGAAFHMYWIPYALAFHRSEFTHGGGWPFGWMIMVLVATPLRIFYAFWWVAILVLKFPSWYDKFASVPLEFWMFIYAGWAAQDVMHWLRDYL